MRRGAAAIECIKTCHEICELFPHKNIFSFVGEDKFLACIRAQSFEEMKTMSNHLKEFPREAQRKCFDFVKSENSEKHQTRWKKIRRCCGLSNAVHLMCLVHGQRKWKLLRHCGDHKSASRICLFSRFKRVPREAKNKSKTSMEPSRQALLMVSNM